MLSQYIEWEKRGLFIAPEESADEFEARVALVAQSGCKAPELLQELFGIDPSWVRCEYVKKGLYPWEAGCTWYDDVPWIQLHPRFKEKKKLFGLYDKEEVLAHEYVHVVRAPLGSSRFEEIFAYLVSYYRKPGALSLFRTFLGPLFDRPWEIVVTLCFMLLFPVIGFVLLASVFLRLLYSWRQWFLCKKHLAALCTQPLVLMVRLTDEEIILFSKWTPQKIAAFIDQKKQENFRWQILAQNSNYRHI